MLYEGLLWAGLLEGDEGTLMVVDLLQGGFFFVFVEFQFFAAFFELGELNFFLVLFFHQ